jgi:hypothetical protein
MAKDPGRSPGAFTVPNCVQMRLNWTLPNGKIVHNVLHGRVAGGFAATTVAAQAIYAAIIASGSWTAWRPYVNAASSFQGVDLRDMRTLNQAIFASTGGSTAGTGAAVSLPAAAAICITLRTALSGQANRGRVYLPGIDSAADVSATGAILAAANTAAVNFVTAVQTAMTSGGLTMCIQNPPRIAYTGAKTGTLHPAREAGTVDVVGISARSTTFRSQRRRALRV